jgi:S1-C subfamily serine protease
MSLPSLRAAAAAVLPQTVVLHTRHLDADGDVAEGGAAGVILTRHGHILTNAHNLDDRPHVDVELSDGSRHPARVVGVDRLLDIAVLKIKAGRPLTPVSVAPPGSVHVGDVVFAVGMPYDHRCKFSVTQGIVGHTARYKPWENGSLLRHLQTDAALNRGNSGGGLFDVQGRLVGLNSSIRSFEILGHSTGNIGLGFAIEANTAVAIARKLCARRRALTPHLGAIVTDLNPPLKRALGLSHGLYVQAVANTGTAFALGLQPGDVLTHREQATAQLYLRAGDRVTLDWVRNGKTLTGRAVLKARTRRRYTPRPVEKPSVAGLRLRADANGLLVTGVAFGSVADRATLEEDMVLVAVKAPTGDWTPLRTTADLKAALAAAGPAGVLVKALADDVPFVTALHR